MAKPKFLYDNRFTDADPSASSTAAGDYAVANVTDWRAYTWWKGGATPSNITVDCGAPAAADYALIYAEAGTYEIRGSTDNFSASNALVATLTLAAAGLKLVTFNSASYRYWRMLISSGTPAVAILAVGEALESPQYLDGEFSPISRNVHGNTNRNEDGHPLGRVVNFETWEEMVKLPNVSWDWARDEFVPAWVAHLRGSPFGFAWEADTYPEDVYVVQAGDEVRIPHRAGGFCDVEISLVGVI